MQNLTEQHISILAAADYFNSKPEILGFNPMNASQRIATLELVECGLLQDTPFGFMITPEGSMMIDQYASDEDYIN